MREYVIGERVECDGHRGTVLFVGEVPPTKGSWLGVEWDDSTRGRHSGSHEGTQYFVTKNSGAGSFVRINKIQTSRSFCEALSERYLKSSTDGFADENLIQELKDEMNAPFLQLVGFEKIGRQQSKLNELKIAVLNHMRISGCESEDLKEICPKIEELNLSSNLLNSWVAVARIAQQLSRLKLLNVSDNKLAIPENPRSLSTSFNLLTHLTASNMDYTWKDIVRCSYMWPGLQHLAVPNNRITALEFMDSDVLNELRVLNLEGNHIELWEEVNKLGQLPNLEQLSLYGTGLKNIQVKENSFPKLCKLSLSNNNLTQWQHVCELDKLPKLTDLKLCGNPGLKANSYETFSQWVIARIGKLQVLNGTEITSEERRGAELDYLKYHGREYLNSLLETTGRPHPEFLAVHPRYLRLVEKYGAPELAELETKSMTLKNSLISLKLSRKSNMIAKKLPSSMEIQKLRTLCHRLFNADGAEITLFAVNGENPNLFIPLDNDLRPISFYSLQDGDTILVRG